MEVGKLETYGTIYKIQNIINGKVYIGQTTLGFYKRYRTGKWSKYTHNQYLKNSVKKYGVDNFAVNECLDVAFSKEELDKKEEYWISYYGSTNNLLGYNGKSGGANGRPSMETRKKMSMSSWSRNKELSEKIRKIISEAHKGVPMSEQQKEKIRKSSKGTPWLCGKLNHNYGIPMSNDQKKKIGQANKGHIHTKESKIKMSETRIRKGIGIGADNNSAITIFMYDLDMSLVQVFGTRKECAEWLFENGYTHNLVTGKSAISTAITREKSYKGFIFKKSSKERGV